MPTFHHYEVLKTKDDLPWELGRGGMGVTYKALDTKLQCLVALKVINPALFSSATARERFVREARAAARLRHPNVGAVLYLSYEDEPCFYAMEFIEGETVDALVKRQGSVEPGLALRIALQVSSALTAAHREGIVHRDIKPSNLMLCQDGDSVLVKVIDFGLVKSVISDQDETLTQGMVGTPLFASPEQLDGQEVDIRSDIYSLGVTLWYLLGGRTPFVGSTGRVISQHLHSPPPLDELPDLPPRIVSLLEAMLQKDPASRPQTPTELRQTLQSCLNEWEATSNLEPLAVGVELKTVERPAEIVAAEIETPASTNGAKRDFRWLMVTTGAVLIGLAAGVGYFVIPRSLEPDIPSTPTPTPVITPSLPSERVIASNPVESPANNNSTPPARETPQTPSTTKEPLVASVVSTTSFDDLKSLAESGDNDAIVRVAESFLESNTPTFEDAKYAMGLLEKSNDPRAVFWLGRCYAEGWGTPRNEAMAKTLFERARKEFSKAHEAGDSEGTYGLGSISYFANNEPAVAREYFRKGAEKNNANCMAAYAQFLNRNIGGPRNLEGAREWYRKAAELGHEEARRWLLENAP